MRLPVSMVSAMIAAWVLATPSWADTFLFTTGNTDGRLGAASRSTSEGKIEIETADDFILTETTVIKGATITGLINGSSASIGNVEVEFYNKFPLDSVFPPSGRVLSRTNSPADVEIDSATRDGRDGTLSFSTLSLNSNFSVQNTVVNGINPTPSRTGGEGPASGEAVQITITFTKPVVLPAGQYFFRPEVLTNGGDFLFLSAPRSPGVPFVGDLQAWIRSSRLAPDWVRIGTDVIGGDTPATTPTFNMTFSLAGNTIPGAGISGEPNCHGESTSALARQFGGIAAAASTLGFSSVDALQKSFKDFCNS